MDLSPTAVAYLATLRRHPAVPVRQAAEALKKGNYPVLECWLEFHDRFAGYEEIIGHDTAIWASCMPSHDGLCRLIKRGPRLPAVIGGSHAPTYIRPMTTISIPPVSLSAMEVKTLSAGTTS